MIAFIPARGGSKELKNKNIKLFAGKPLIYYTIKEALKSKFISKVLVLTDSIKIAKISKKYGAIVPFLRPKYLATDTSLAADTYLYYLKKLNLRKIYKDFIVLQPTSPLRSSKEIDKAINYYLKVQPNSMISVSKSKFPLEWIKSVNLKGKLSFLKNLYYNKSSLNRQAYQDIYLPNGSIYIIKINKFLKFKKYYYSNNTLAFIMDEKFSINYNDIDNNFHFKLAELIYKFKRNF